MNAYLFWELSKKTVQRALEGSPTDRDVIIGSMNLANEALGGACEDTKFKLVMLLSRLNRRVNLLETKRWMFSVSTPGE